MNEQAERRGVVHTDTTDTRPGSPEATAGTPPSNLPDMRPGFDLLKKIFPIAVLLLVTALALAEWRPSVITEYHLPVLLAVTVPSLVAVLPASTVSLYVWVSQMSDRRLSVLSVSAASVLGAVVTVSAAALNGTAVEITGAFDHPYSIVLFLYLFAAPVEEVTKMVVMYVTPRRCDEVMDYIVIGAFAGFGFAFGENVFRLLTAGVGANPHVLPGFLLMRAPAAILHVTVSAIAGYYLGRTRLRETTAGGKVRTLAKGLLLVILLHATYNTVMMGFLPEDILSTVPGQSVETVAVMMLFLTTGYGVYRITERARCPHIRERTGTATKEPSAVADD